MEDLDAPQWADFTAPSPQVALDDFFLRRHLKHEYRENRINSDSPTVSSPKIGNPSKVPLSDISTSNENILINTPVRKIVSKGTKSLKTNIIETTTVENVLSEAMNNLQLSFKNKQHDKSINKSCLIDTPTYKTPSKRVTRSMCALVTTTPGCKLENFHKSPENEKCIENKVSLINFEENKENEDILEESVETDLNHSGEIKEDADQNNLSEQNSQINLEVTATSTEHEISHEKLETEAVEQSLSNKNKSSVAEEQRESSNNLSGDKNLPKGRVVTSFTSHSNDCSGVPKKKVTVLAGNARRRQTKRRSSIINQRRLSISKHRALGLQNAQHGEKEASVPHVSIAEAVLKFQRATPQRFRSQSVKSTRTEQLQLTRAQSPALISKMRSRPVTVLSRKEQEELEIEKMRQNQFKAHPLRKDILEKPAPIKKVGKKMVTNPEPFHLTKTKKEIQPIKPSQEIKRLNSFTKKTVPSITNDENGIIVKEEEVTGFGIPLEPCKIKKKNTKVQPFSFEARNKQLAIKKQERLKKMQESEQQKNKAEFHARPVPTAVKVPLNKQASKNDSVKTTKITLSRSVSFESKIKESQQKKEEKIKQIMEEEKKARIFKAQKVPDFKPVLVRGRSRDLLKRSNENLASKPHASNAGKEKSNISVHKSQENLVPRPNNIIKKPLSLPLQAPKKTLQSVGALPKITAPKKGLQSQVAVPKIMAPKCKLSQKSVAVLSELNTEKRAKERKEFDEKLKKKDEEDEERKQLEEKERIAKEEEQKSELRKMAEVKARPMPVYKPLQIIKSNKALTDPQSPAWSRKKSTH